MITAIDPEVRTFAMVFDKEGIGIDAVKGESIVLASSSTTYSPDGVRKIVSMMKDVDLDEAIHFKKYFIVMEIFINILDPSIVFIIM